MHLRTVRSAARTLAVTIAAGVVATLAWAPTVSAQTVEPTPTASSSPALRDMTDTEVGGVQILTKDPGGDVLSGATFTLVDVSGQGFASGRTNAAGQLSFPDLAAGVYRLKETSSGSPIHEVVADQDVIVTPGATTRLTITDPFKAAKVLLQAKDDKTGKLLPGATVNIGTGTSTLLTLTTGAKGTASGELPVSSRKTQFWVKEIKAPTGYDLSKLAKSFTAKPGSPVSVTVTNTKTTNTTPTSDSSEKPSGKPTAAESAPDQSTQATGGSTSSARSDTEVANPTISSSSASTVEGTLAHTGADATPWLIGCASFLLAAGTGSVFAARRRRIDGPNGPSQG